MSNTKMYDLNHNQIANLIATTGHENTILVTGNMGWGKTSIQHMLKKELTKVRPETEYTFVYCDCTTKDIGDLAVPMFQTMGEDGVVRYATNEELGLHLDGPVCILFDEVGKANQAVKTGLTRLFLERENWGRKLHPDSIIWATTNKGSEGLGDMLQAHQRDRITCVNLRNPDNMEWIEWGIDNNVDPAMLAWAKDTPQLFHTFEDYENPDENPYIFHPRAQREKFVTGRGMAKASAYLRNRDMMDDTTMTAALIGTIGARGAMDLMAYVTLADQLPSLDSIKESPETAKVPTSPGAICMVVYRTLATLEREWVKPWMTYLNRLHKEAQGLFVQGVRAKGYSKRDIVAQTKEFQDWCLNNNYMFSEDK